MGRLAFLAKRLANMNYRGLFDAVDAVAERSGRAKAVVLADMALCAVRYQAGYSDYQMFEFESIPASVRATYITRGKNNAYVKKLNNKADWPLFEDKAQFLRLFDGLHGRAWLDLRESDAQTLARFTKEHPSIVAKPPNGTCGRGIDFYDIEAGEAAEAVDLYERLCTKGQYVVEQVLEQHPVVSRLHPPSVNTLRLVTIVKDGVPELMFSCIRIGNGARVDNVNSGGMAALLDVQAGIICSPAADKTGASHHRHPVSDVELVGYHIPFCAEAVALVKGAALRVPGIRYVGWDVAIAPDRPVLIEGNQFPGHDLYQFPVHLGEDRKGLAPIFDKAVGPV